jgi:hypothetical protein
MPDLTDTVHASCIDESRPEVLLDMLGSINAEAVDCALLVIFQKETSAARPV